MRYRRALLATNAALTICLPSSKRIDLILTKPYIYFRNTFLELIFNFMASLTKCTKPKSIKRANTASPPYLQHRYGVLKNQNATFW